MNAARWMNAAAAMMAVIAGALIALAAVRWVAQKPAFDLHRIEVRGELQHVTAASLRAAIAGRLRGNWFTMRLDETRRLFETVPWVAQASVRRVWPDRLEITLREHRALGAWGDGRLLSDRGELFVANVAEAEVFGPLPSFDGPDDEARSIAARFYEFVAALASIALTVDSIDVSERRSWSLIASGPGVAATTIALGRDDGAGAVQRRLTDLVSAYPMVLARIGGAPAQIDARYANGLAASAPRNSDSKARRP